MTRSYKTAANHPWKGAFTKNGRNQKPSAISINPPEVVKKANIATDQCDYCGFMPPFCICWNL